ncbi:MAG: DUF2203 domain-containing protein [Planctomycetota bacterium]
MVALRKLYTPQEANRALPLVRAIARDVRDTAVRIRAIWGELQATDGASASRREELGSQLDDERARLQALTRELEELGVELKDPMVGLLDFRARRGGGEVYLCWRLGEERVEFWHECDAGFAGRQPIDTF